MFDGVVDWMFESGSGTTPALSFARQGHEVFATVRNTRAGQAAPGRRERRSLDLHVLRLDVRDADSVDGAVAEVVERSGRIDVCVNNAGIELRGPIEECSDDEVLVQFDTNVFGLLRVVRAVIPVMREQGGGVIVNVGSIAGSCPGRSAASTRRRSTRSRPSPRRCTSNAACGTSVWRWSSRGSSRPSSPATRSRRRGSTRGRHTRR